MKTDSDRAASSDPAVLRVRGLTKNYVRRRSVWGQGERIVAASDVTFELRAGETLALVGASGSGKSTVARCVAGLEKPDAGMIWIAGTDIAHLDSAGMQPWRAKCQMVFQDPATSMNPRWSAAEVVAEPLRVQKRGDKVARRQRARELMQEVGVSPQWADRPALDFSGGQRQRLAIARALALRPSILILDEALSGLDLSTEAQIVNLLRELQITYRLAYLVISHDLALVARLADHVAVMANGKIVEYVPAPDLFARAAHDDTRALLTASEKARENLAAVLGITR